MLKQESPLLITLIVGVVYLGVIVFTAIVAIVMTWCCCKRKEKRDWDTRPVSYAWRIITAILAIMVSIGLG